MINQDINGSIAELVASAVCTKLASDVVNIAAASTNYIGEMAEISGSATVADDGFYWIIAAVAGVSYQLQNLDGTTPTFAAEAANITIHSHYRFYNDPEAKIETKDDLFANNIILNDAEQLITSASYDSDWIPTEDVSITSSFQRSLFHMGRPMSGYKCFSALNI